MARQEEYIPIRPGLILGSVGIALIAAGRLLWPSGGDSI